MRPIAIAVLLALSASLPAQAMDYYAGVGMRQAPSADEHPYLVGVQIEEDNDVYARAFGGVWLNENFAIEGAYHDFGSSRLGPLTDFGFHLESEGWSLGLLYEYGDAAWAPYTKIGWFTADIDGEIITVAGPQPFSDSDSGLMLEAGVRWTPNDSFSLRGGYEWFDFAGGGDGGLGIGAQISF